MWITITVRTIMTVTIARMDEVGMRQGESTGLHGRKSGYESAKRLEKSSSTSLLFCYQQVQKTNKQTKDHALVKKVLCNVLVAVPLL